MKRTPVPLVGLLVWSGCNAILGNEEKRVGEEATSGASSGGTDSLVGGSQSGGKVNGGTGGAGPAAGSDSGKAGGVSVAGRATGGTGQGESGAGGDGSLGGGPASPEEGCTQVAGPVAGDGENLAIDYLDDNNLTFSTAGVGMGYWLFGRDPDKPGMITPSDTMSLVPVAGGQSGKALHVQGSGLTGWGAALNAVLDDGGTSFDASAYAGIAFYIKGTTDVVDGTNVLRVQARMPDVLEGPGSCCDQAVADAQCYSSHSAVIQVTGNWNEIELPWSAFVAATWGFGKDLAFNPNRIKDITFAFDHFDQTPAGGASFDVWIDGLRFLSK